MPENLMCAEHKSNSKTYRENWERTFRHGEITITKTIGPDEITVKKVIFNKNDCAISKLFQPDIGVYRGATFTERGEY